MNNPINCQISVKALKAALVFAATDGDRDYLNSVCIEFTKHGALAVSSNGHCLVVCQASSSMQKPETEYAGISIIIPRCTIYSAMILSEYSTTEYATLAFDVENNAASLESVPFIPINALFPQWRLIFPHKLSAETAQFNPKYLVGAEKALAIYSQTEDKLPSNKVHHNGSDPALVTSRYSKSIFVLIAPLREPQTEVFPTKFDWIQE